MKYGSRFLDIQPVSRTVNSQPDIIVKPRGLWDGGNGQTIAEIIDNVYQ
jgi:hypothetical protein